MKRSQVWSVIAVLVGLMCSYPVGKTWAQVNPNTYININGTVRSGSGPVSIDGTYGNITITPLGGVADATAEIVDGNSDVLLIKNAKITATGNIDNYPIEMWKEMIAAPTGPPPNVYYKTEVYGKWISQAAGNWISVDQYVTHGGQTRNLSYKKVYQSCIAYPATPASCQFTTSVKTSGPWNSPPLTGNRTVKFIMKLKLKAGDILELNTNLGTGTSMFNSANADSSDPDGPPLNSSCPTAGPLSSSCATTQWTVEVIGCPSCVSETEKTTFFAKASSENLSQDMARGSGEYLAALATLMKIPEDRHPAFFALAQSEFQSHSAMGQAVQPATLISVLHEKMILEADPEEPILMAVK
jgi:hypothetical protein